MQPEEIKFLRDTANELLKENAPVLLEYGDVHSRAFGTIVDVKPGGIVFQDEQARDGLTDYLTWSKIDRMQRRASAVGALGEKSRTKTAGR